MFHKAIRINTLKGFEDIQDYYFVEYDKIYSDLKKLKELHTYKKKDGYCNVKLQTKDGKTRTISVHRIVCSAYHDNIDNKPEVNHINHNRADNRPENLEWSTRQEQMNKEWKRKASESKKGKPKSEEHKRKIGEAHKGRKMPKEHMNKMSNTHKRKVVMLDEHNNIVEQFDSLKKCAIYLKVHKSAISQAIRNSGKCRGFKIMYREDYDRL